MKTLIYKKFSSRFHKNKSRRNALYNCQFELTFRCGLHCRHCYTGCYNESDHVKRELGTSQVKFILDRISEQGALWLCFTGGDPLSRDDFLELYAYAKAKAFIITLFTNAYSMNEKIARYLKEKPPFVIEITLNAVTQGLYEKISRIKGSYAKVMRGIELILKANLPLKIKSDIMKYNFEEAPKITKFVEGLGLKYIPNYLLNGRLDGDLTPCELRISAPEALHLSGADKDFPSDNCSLIRHEPLCQPQGKRRKAQHKLFSCAIGGGGSIYIDPYGNLVPCIFIREPHRNLLKVDIVDARREILNWVRGKQLSRDSICWGCHIRSNCCSCPGKALLETGNLKERISWFCEFAHLTQARHSKRL